jgi:N-acetylmuramoyl-L-alanine amidase
VGCEAIPTTLASVKQRRTPTRLLLIAATLCALSTAAGCGKSLPESETPPTTTAQPVALRPGAPTAANSPQTAERASTPPATSSAPHPASAFAQGRTSEAPPPTRPPIVQSPIPFTAKRKAEMVRYAERHYALHTYRLIEPHVIVIHFTETPNFSSTFNTFAPDTPDPELHELPNTCAHFVIDADGTIHQLVPLGIMCRHTVGLNWTAIGIEHVGYSDAEVLDRPAQMRASLRLVRWLRCRYAIPIEDVIGHNESLSSPFHHENVSSLRTQTHNDFNHADMRRYRARLRSAGAC